MEDPFAEQKKQKRDRVKAQDKRQLDNLKTTARAGGAAALPSTLRLAATLPEHGKGRPVKRKELHDDVWTPTSRPANPCCKGHCLPSSALHLESTHSTIWECKLLAAVMPARCHSRAAHNGK